ncbi:hypothetical protein CIB84_015248 [Bambusicola thoracicus]|uniref:Uncharacterized protein n=1 Tax=Bambusicola thoracicus TaxID=9083 RepID=A0A2P4SA50_BAMTH|nr:hypothetical protein CIB84_015248 [Bambusicola thoracicus]
MQESSLYLEQMGIPSLLRMLPTAAEVENLTAVFCRKELWKGADRTTIIGGGTLMTVESCLCSIAAFDQQGQAIRHRRHGLGMAGTGHSRTWISAEVGPGRNVEEKAEHTDTRGAVHETPRSTPMSHLVGW